MTDGNIAHTATMAEQALPVGTTLSGDQFTITGHLGIGGFGITYRAMDNVLGRTIVIKECFPEDFCARFGSNVMARHEAHAKPFRSIVNMFMREARSLAKLRHPNIVGVHRAFEENETAYMAIDLIDGRDLFDLLEEHANLLSPARVEGILLQLLDAIEEVHSAGLLHRDISPDNIIIEKSGKPVLIDFGAAKGDAGNQTRAVSTLLVVKDGYSPQEFYVAGSEQGPCSDLYALAATFYHVLSGHAPVNSQTRMMEIAGKRPDPCVPLYGRIKGYSDSFLRAIDHAMEIHPSDRLQSAAKWKQMILSEPSEASSTEKSTPRLTPSEMSLELELSLSRLVEETNVEVRKSKGQPKEPEKAAAPVKTERKPAWIDEFNRDSARPTSRKRAPRSATHEWIKAHNESSISQQRTKTQDTEASSATKRTRSETNWVDRAQEKQERVRSEAQAALETQQAKPKSRAKSLITPAVDASTAPKAKLKSKAKVRDEDHLFEKRRPVKIAIGLVLGFFSVFLFTTM